MRRAQRRRRLLEIGISLTEQERIPTFELDAILAVDDVINRVVKDENDKAAGNVRS